MQLETTGFEGLFIVRCAPAHDERGSFQRLYDADAFAAHGVTFDIRQSGLSRNRAARTLRGMHYQKLPARQAKLVRCVAGRIFDAVIDLRDGSATNGRWFGCELAANDGRALLVPAGFAHGFLTLEDGSDVLYELSAGEAPGLAGGVRWNDPRFAVRWPAGPLVINARDAAWPDYTG